MKAQIQLRTKSIALEVIKLMNELSNKAYSWIISKQIIRSSSSVAANYRTVCRAKPTADFIYKLKINE